MLSIVVDLGNSRLKWARLDRRFERESTVALPTDDPVAWLNTLHSWNPSGEPTAWAIASVNPPVADRLSAFLANASAGSIRWYRSAADVPVRHELDRIETAGADRALAVLGAIDLQRPGRPGLVVSCGTAITVERVSPDGTWQGGAIAPGLGPSARALHQLTAQLPLIHPGAAPEAWGPNTESALSAGLFWGAVGSVRELVTRQGVGLSPRPWLVWSGGDAPILAPWIDWEEARVIPDLVLMGLARVAFGGGEARRP